MHQVGPYRLWLGSVVDAWSLREVLQCDVQAIIDLASNEAPLQLTRDLIYCRFPIVDGVGNDPAVLRLAIDTVIALMQNGTPTFLFCSAGMSRSPAILAAAIARQTKRSLSDCLAEVVLGHPHDVAAGLVHDLQRLDTQLRDKS